eukprot:CAMPEP_0116885252 /NCGR_PEP_ID=MMETSP0463-20121206/18542_1 /TAXON_ID=181622 /ORGANISM="Strombidinopsis sp, Strain SopsisLIS2011" /LENGTH=89 /DNA_ID=CAMNT_0004543367 /DNA_START=130 /DNA_END=399 /DNA_ORIENTATION=-
MPMNEEDMYDRDLLLEEDDDDDEEEQAVFANSQDIPYTLKNKSVDVPGLVTETDVHKLSNSRPKDSSSSSRKDNSELNGSTGGHDAQLD